MNDFQSRPPPKLKPLLRKTFYNSLLNTQQLYITIFLLIMSTLPLSVYSAKPSKKRQGRNRSSHDNERRSTSDSITRFFTVLKTTYMLVFLPIILFFLYGLYRDPAVPQIFRALVLVFKRKVLGYLGKGEEVDVENKNV